MSLYSALTQNVATVDLQRQRTPIRITNLGPTIAVLLHPLGDPIRYWELKPHQHFDILRDFPSRLLIAGNVTLEPIES